MAKQTGFDSKLHSILAEHMRDLVAEITHAVRQNIALQIGTFLGPKETTVAKTPRKRAGRTAKKRAVGFIAPNCTNP